MYGCLGQQGNTKKCMSTKHNELCPKNRSKQTSTVGQFGVWQLNITDMTNDIRAAQVKKEKKMYTYLENINI